MISGRDGYVFSWRLTNYLLAGTLLFVTACAAPVSGPTGLQKFDQSFVPNQQREIHFVTDAPAGYSREPYHADLSTANALRVRLRMTSIENDAKWAPSCKILLADTVGLTSDGRRSTAANLFGFGLMKMPGESLSLFAEEIINSKSAGTFIIKSGLKINDIVEFGVSWDSQKTVSLYGAESKVYSLKYNSVIRAINIGASTASCAFDSVRFGNI
jgi:hypothetical protein